MRYQPTGSQPWVFETSARLRREASAVSSVDSLAVGTMSDGSGEPTTEVPPVTGRGIHIVVEYCKPCGFESAYLELASAVKEEYPDVEIESRLGGTGTFEIEINGQLIFSKLENGGFPYEKDLIEAIRRASNGEPLEKITKSRPPCVIL